MGTKLNKKVNWLQIYLHVNKQVSIEQFQINHISIINIKTLDKDALINTFYFRVLARLYNITDHRCTKLPLPITSVLDEIHKVEQ